MKDDSMRNLFLEKPSIKHKQQYEEMMNEWETYGGRINPGALRRYSKRIARNVSYEEWLKWVEEDSDNATCPPESAPQHLYFLVDDAGRVLGATSIRPCLNEALKKSGGHMGGGIRPSERMKGYATRMLSLSLPLAKSFGIDRLLITCDKDNIGSAKAIINNNGILENEIVEENGNVVQRYWIDL